MKTFEFKPQNVCPQKISFSLEGETISDVHFFGGCAGNSQGISKLLEGANVKDTIDRLENIDCGRRGTSCPSELAKALKEAIKE
jgi:uncharacterized protein (TIGR03905 family)